MKAVISASVPFMLNNLEVKVLHDSKLVFKEPPYTRTIYTVVREVGK